MLPTLCVNESRNASENFLKPTYLPRVRLYTCHIVISQLIIIIIIIIIIIVIIIIIIIHHNALHINELLFEQPQLATVVIGYLLCQSHDVG